MAVIEIGVSISTYRKRQKKSSAIPELELEKAMCDLATGKFYVEETKTVLDPKNGEILKIERVKKQVPPNPALQMFLAKKQMPEKYCEKDEFDF